MMAHGVCVCVCVYLVLEVLLECVSLQHLLEFAHEFELLVDGCHLRE